MKELQLSEIVMKLVGSVQPAGKSEIDSERFENLKVLCELVNDLVTEIDNVSYINKDAYEHSVVKAKNYASNFLTKSLGITE